MYSPNQQTDYTNQFGQRQQQSQQHRHSQQDINHTTVGAVPVMNPNNTPNRMFSPSSYQQQQQRHNQYHQRQNSYGTVTSAIAMSPPQHHHAGGLAAAAAAYAESNNSNQQHWFGTSFDSASSFGQSPPNIFTGTSAAGSSGRGVPTSTAADLIVSPSNSSTHLDHTSFVAAAAAAHAAVTANVGSGSSNNNANNITEDEDTQQQRNLQEMFEKRRRRRESHNAVERRRRDNINERIHELCTLLPERLLDTAPTSSNVMSVASGQVGANGRAINKGTILRLSVDYIKELRDELHRCENRIQELEHIVEYNKNSNDDNSSLSQQRQTQVASHNNSGDILDNRQQEHLQAQTSGVIGNTTGGGGHQRVGSIQFRQQFDNMQITSPMKSETQ